MTDEDGAPREFVLQAPLVRVIGSLAWPIALSNELSTLVLMVRVFWLGRLFGDNGQLVESLFRPVSSLLALVLEFVCVGASVLVSQSIGRRDGQGFAIVRTSIGLMLLIWFVLALALSPFAPAVARVLVGANITLSDAMQMFAFAWLLAALPGLLVADLLLDTVHATGWTKFALVRIVLDLVFMAALIPVLADVVGFGIAGVPLAEALAGLVLIAVLWTSMVKYRQKLGLGERVRLAWDKKLSVWREIASIGLPVQLSRIAMFIAQGVLIHMVAAESTDAAIGYSIALGFVMFGAGASIAVAEAGAVTIGQCIGAKQFDRAKRAVPVMLGWGFGIMTLFAIGTLADEHVIPLLNNDPAVVAAAEYSLSIFRWALFGVTTWQCLVATFAAFGASLKASVVATIAEALGVGVALLWPGSRLDAACAAFCVSNGVKGLSLVVLFLATRNQLQAPATTEEGK